jgi:cell shape-determining protein MreD
MMAILFSIPVLGLALIIQTAIVSRINLLAGSADIVLLVVVAWGLQPNVKWPWVWAVLAGALVGYVSGLPVFIAPVSYLLIMGMARLMQRRVWQAPLLAMFAVTFLGTLLMQVMTYVTLWLLGNQLAVGDVFLQVTLPSILLNLFLSIPIHALMRDTARWLYPAESEV